MEINTMEYITLEQLQKSFHIDWVVNEKYEGLFVPVKLKKYNLPDDYIEGDYTRNAQKRVMNQLTCYLRAIGYKKDYINIYIGDSVYDS